MLDIDEKTIQKAYEIYELETLHWDIDDAIHCRPLTFKEFMQYYISKILKGETPC